MTTQALPLLPSQQALALRLQHVNSFSEKLLVLSGEKGSGKSTIVAALACDSEEYNSALVICPQHASSAEIRRKVLVQLISAPIFDDELSLMDTIIRIQSSLTKPLHIIIDDAHLLPKNLWVECILLSQMHCANLPIAVTMTVLPGYWPRLLAELDDDIAELLLHVVVEPLPIDERDSLFQSLLSRSQLEAFIPSEIAHRHLEAQTGTPEEVVTLVTQTIQPPSTINAKLLKTSRYVIVSLLLLAMLVIGGNYLLGTNEDKDTNLGDVKQLTVEQTRHRNTANAYVKSYAETLLSDYFVHRYQVPLPISILLPSEDLSAKDKSSQASNQQAKAIPKPVAKQAKAIVPAAETSPILTSQVSQLSNVRHPSGLYTLQVASVNERKSVDAFLALLKDESHVFVAQQQSRFVILVGDFTDSKAALAKSKQIQSRLKLGKPWLRKWSDLKDYDLQN